MDQNYPPPGQVPHQPPPQPPAMGGAPQAYHPHPQHQQQGNGMAVAAMVLGIVGLVLFWVPFLGLICALLGAILGFTGLSKANKLGGKGKGMAIAGIVTGIVGTLIGAWYIYAIFVAVEAAKDYPY